MAKTSALLSDTELKVIDTFFKNTNSTVLFPGYLKLAASLFEYVATKQQLDKTRPEWFSSICSALREEMSQKIQLVLGDPDLQVLLKNYKNVMKYALERFIFTDWGIIRTPNDGIFSEPREISSFINSLFEADQEETIYTPFAGYCTHIQFSQHKAHYVGEEINPHVWAVAQLNIFANDLDADIQCANSFDELKDPTKKYGTILMMPPFMLRDADGNTEFTALHDAVENKLTEDGHLIAILPTSFLFANGRTGEIRRKLVERRQILSAMILPPVYTQHNVKVCVLCITKKSNENMIFLDFSSLMASDEYVRKFSYRSALEAIEQQNLKYGKSVPYAELLQKPDANLQQIGFGKELPKSEYPTIPLGELVEFLPRRVKRDISGYFITAPTRSTEYVSDFSVSLSNCETKALKSGIEVLPNSLVIFLIVHNSLKYRFVVDDLKSDNSPNIVASSEAVNVVVKGDEVLRDYLLLTLKSEYITLQLDYLRTGMAIPRISPDALKEILVPVPPRDKQLSLLQEEYDRIKDLHSKAYLADEGRKDIYSVVSNLRHMLGSPFSNISVAIENLKMYLPDNEDYKQSLDYLKDNLDYVSRLIDLNCQTIDTSKKSKIDVEKFFKTYVDKWNNYGSKNFELKLSFSIVPGTYIVGNETALTVMLDELLRNADKHGFRRKYSDENYVDISVELIDADSDEPKILLDVTNNGKPFPEDFTIDDYITAGKFNKETGTSGLGGRQVYNICKSFGGDMDLLTDATDGKTTFLFFIPANR